MPDTEADIETCQAKNTVTIGSTELDVECGRLVNHVWSEWHISSADVEKTEDGKVLSTIQVHWRDEK